MTKLSGGQKQRFSIVASLVNDPEIIFLDEPTTGLDPKARRHLSDLITQIKTKKKTIILTTHYMEEAEILCDRVAIMDKGKIIAIDKTIELLQKVKHPYKIEFVLEKQGDAVVEKIARIGDLTELAGKSNHYELRLSSKQDLPKALNLVQKLNPLTLSVGKASLEDVFIELTGKTIDQGEPSA